MSTPSDFSKSPISFTKLDDLPKGGKAYSQFEVLKAMLVLHKMNHKQSDAYGGKNSKLYPVGIAEELSPEEVKHKELYAKWRKLINMSATSLENFKASQTAKGRKNAKEYPGLKPKEASSIGISSGVQSANWIIKMKRTPVKDWTPEMWTWAGKQVSFVSRMLGNTGPLYDADGKPTRKNLSLLIWGHRSR